MPEIKDNVELQSESVVVNNSVETRHIVDQKPEAPVPPELRSFLQRIEQSPTANPTFDPTGQPNLSPSVPSNPKIILPVSRTTFVSGFKKRIDDVGNWLSRFIFREIKLKEGDVSFKSDDS